MLKTLDRPQKWVGALGVQICIHICTRICICVHECVRVMSGWGSFKRHSKHRPLTLHLKPEAPGTEVLHIQHLEGQRNYDLTIAATYKPAVTILGV